MSDNLTTPVASGSILATDDVAGVQYPRVKVSFGIDGSAADVSASSRFPVDVGASIAVTQSGTWSLSATQSGAWNITNITGTVSLPTGAATSALQTTGNTSLASIATLLGGTLAISAAALPLPAGAATAAKQDVAGPSNTYVPVSLSSSNLTNGACKAIVAETAGRVNLKQPDGTARSNYPLVAGLNPIGALMIDAPASGTAATGVWALY